jgi:hypothetical protein
MIKVLAGEGRVAKRRLCLDERGSRRRPRLRNAVQLLRLRASEEDTVLRRGAGASRQEQKR